MLLNEDPQDMSNVQERLSPGFCTLDQMWKGDAAVTRVTL